MKKFAVNLMYFLLPIGLSAYFIDSFLSVNLQKSNSFAVKEFPVWNAICEGKVNSDIVIYGSSRAWVHINPTMISDSLHVSAYNLGIDGHGFWLQNLRHVLLLKNNAKPKLIIHSIDAGTLSGVSDLYNSDQFLPYMLWNREMKNATIVYNGYELADYEIPLVRYYGKYAAIKMASKMFVHSQDHFVGRVKGYEGQDIPWNSDFDKVKLKMKSYTEQLDSASVKLFEKYLLQCKADNIQIIFVYTPEYIEGQRFTENREEIMKFYNQLSEKYSIPFYDFSNDEISYNKEYFYNTSHLNKTGSELLTKKIIAILRKFKFRFE
jgi:hypothetical protein